MSTQSDLNRVDKIEIGDTHEQGSKTVNGNLLFSFEASHPPNIESVTPTKFSKNAKNLKRSINDLSFMPKPIIWKNLRTHHFQDSSLLIQILSQFDMLSDSVESQTAHIKSHTAHIIALEKRKEELIFQFKVLTQANKANQGATKKIETITDRVAAIAATSLAQPGFTNESTPSQGSSRPGFSRSDAVLKKTSPYLALNLSEYTSTLNKRPLKEIRQHLQPSIKVANRTK